MIKSRVCAAVIVGCILSSILALRAAQTESGRPPADNAVVRELLAEVRALRTEIGWIGNSSIRTQLLTARLQLQEQRIYTTARQAAEAENEVAGIRERIAETERHIANAEEQEPGASATRAQQLRDALAEMRAVLKQLKQREAQLHARQLESLNTMTSEQSRWMAFNNRLDELEQSLTKRAGQ